MRLARGQIGQVDLVWLRICTSVDDCMVQQPQGGAEGELPDSRKGDGLKEDFAEELADRGDLLDDRCVRTMVQDQAAGSSSVENLRVQSLLLVQRQEEDLA